MKIYKFINKLALLAILALVAGACSEDDDDSYYESNITDLTVREYVENGARNTAGNAQYTMLFQALQKANLLGALEGNVTLLAPNDDAFLAAGIVIEDTPADVLASVLTYHVIPGVNNLEALTGAVTTVEGNTVNFAGACLNGVSTIEDADVTLNNGVVHQIDEVLFPPTGTLVGKVGEFASAATPEFTILQAAVVKAGLAGELSGSTRYTIFAPTDAAFEAAGITADLINNTLTAEQVGQVLAFHALEGEVFSCAVETGRVETVAGPLDEIQGVDIVVDGGVFVNGAEVVNADVLASNGVIHVVDQVIFPEVTVVEAFEGTGSSCVTCGSGFGNLDAFLFGAMGDAVARLGLDQPDSILGDLTTNYSVVTPSFGSFSEAAFASDDDLREVVKAHIFEGVTNPDDVGSAGGTRLESVNGAQYFVTSSDNGVYINGTVRNAGAGFNSDFAYGLYNGLLYATASPLTPLPEESMQELLAADANFDLFAKAMELTGQTASGDYTVFAIDNATFTAAFDYATVADLDTLALEEDNDLETLAAVEEALSNHIVPGVYFVIDIADGTPPTLTALSGEELPIANNNGDYTILVDADIIANSPIINGVDIYLGANGIVHQVDAVIEP